MNLHNGLFGDICVSENMRHRHYSLRDVRKLLEGKFEVLLVRRFALLLPILSVVAYLWGRLRLPGRGLITKAQDADECLKTGRLACNLILKARKRA